MALIYLSLILLVILNYEDYIKKIFVTTFCYITLLLLIYKYVELFDFIANLLKDTRSLISGIDIKTKIYFGYNIALVVIGIVILIILLQRERKKREPFKKENWGDFKEYIFKDGILSIILSLLVIVIGMIGAGFVNLQNAELKESMDLIRFVLSGTVGLITILLGIGLISPLVDFRFRYNFLKNYENNNAKFVYDLRNRSENIKSNNLGIISFQLFELTKTTFEKNIVYEFNEVWRNDSKYDKVSKFKPKKIEVPTEIINLFSRDTTKEIDINSLNKYTSLKFISKLSKEQTYVPAIYLRALYDFLFELYYRENISEESLLLDIDDIKKDNPIVKDFESWINDWKVNKNVFKVKNRYKSVHYINFFEIKNFIQISFDEKKERVLKSRLNEETKNLDQLFLNIADCINDSSVGNKLEFLTRIKGIESWHKKDIKKIVEQQEKENSNLVRYSLLRNYKGGKSRKENRGYYNLCLETENEGEGKRRFVLLLIADTKMINEQSALLVFKNVL